MNAGEIAVLVIVCVAFVAAVVGIIVGKVRHKGGCCDCSCGKSGACSSACPHCSPAVPSSENDESRRK